jgi:transcriptional regulator with XRE-family HTH domain
MSTKKKMRDAAKFLDELTGRPLTFGDALAAIRKCEDMSQAELARRAGVTRSTICDLEKGRRLPSPELAARYARILRHSDKQFVRLALQDQLRKAGIKYQVTLVAA